jgi:hypothetical protein
MALSSTLSISVDAGGTFSFDPTTLPDTIYLNTDTSPMPADFTLEMSTPMLAGQQVKVFIPLIDANGFNVDVFGYLANTPTPASALGWVYTVSMDANGNQLGERVPLDFTDTGIVSGLIIESATLDIDALVDTTNAADILVSNSLKRLTPVQMTGDISISDAGVTAIGAGVIVNADINAAAAIARTKIANATPAYVLINDGSGTMSQEAQLAKSRGGFGQSVAASTGFTKWDSGTLDISAINESMNVQVSFETDECPANNTYTLGHDCTLTATNCSAFVLKLIEASNDALVTMKKNGVAISAGTITFAAGSAIDAAGVFGAFSDTSFSAGDTISFVTSKATKGGKANITLQFSRLK